MAEHETGDCRSDVAEKMTNSEESRDGESFPLKSPEAFQNGIGNCSSDKVETHSQLKLLSNGLYCAPVPDLSEKSDWTSADVNNASTQSDREPSKESTGDAEESTQTPLPKGQIGKQVLKRLAGEVFKYELETANGIMVLTNYRLYTKETNTHNNIPLGLIESVECRDILSLNVLCKDSKCIKIVFSDSEKAVEASKVILDFVNPLKPLEENFSFVFYDKNMHDKNLDWEFPEHLKSPIERFNFEIKRMKFNVNGPWRISKENVDFTLCDSYPPLIIVPSVIDKQKLEDVANFRSCQRFPAVVWRHKKNGAVISRSSQPAVGWFGWRCNPDEELVEHIVLACADNCPQAQRTFVVANNQDSRTNSISSNDSNQQSFSMVPNPPAIKKLLILDARSYTTAFANRTRGGGFECLEYYTKCDIQFMNLANIHSIRKSFMSIRQICSAPCELTWLSQLEGCKWLQHMSGLIKASVTVATVIEHEGRPVLVHCSDGWDRTPQIVALAEILLDPYYRTFEGFQILVEREWVEFGHKFGHRCGQGLSCEDINERCPVFLQWLDCIHQLLLQFPCAFEFNMLFLVKLAQHTYAGIFGTFLCNTVKERKDSEIDSKTFSVWKYLCSPTQTDFRNNLYYYQEDLVLWPSCELRDLKLWAQIYLGYDNPPQMSPEVVKPSQDGSPAPSVHADNLPVSHEELTSGSLTSNNRARSCNDLSVVPSDNTMDRTRSNSRLSDSGAVPREELQDSPSSLLVGDNGNNESLKDSSLSPARRNAGTESFDIDGLITQKDEMQSRLNAIEAGYKDKIAAMELKIYKLSIALKRQTCLNCQCRMETPDEATMIDSSSHFSDDDSSTSSSWDRADINE